MGGPEADPHSAHALFGLGAYDTEPSPAVEAAARAWLEQQAAHPFIREVSDRSMEALDLRAGQRVLDVGCGTGVFLPTIAAKVGSGGRVVGLDHPEAFLREARTRVADHGLEAVVSLVSSDAHHLPSRESSESPGKWTKPPLRPPSTPWSRRTSAGCIAVTP